MKQNNKQKSAFTKQLCTRLTWLGNENQSKSTLGHQPNFQCMLARTSPLTSPLTMNYEVFFGLQK